MNILCKGCKKDSGSASSGGSVGDDTKRTGFIWIPSAGGEAIWLCLQCANGVFDLTETILGITGELYTYLPTLRDSLKRSLETHESNKR